MALHRVRATILLDPRNRILIYKTNNGGGEFHLTEEFETCVAQYFANKMDKVKLEFKSKVVHSKTSPPYKAVGIFIISDTRVANDLAKKINHLSRYGVVEFPRVSGGAKELFYKIPILGDNHCFYRSIAVCFSREYAQYEPSLYEPDDVRTLREENGKLINQEEHDRETRIMQHLRDEVADFISQNWGSYSEKYDNNKDQIDSIRGEGWAGQPEIEAVTQLFGVNICMHTHIGGGWNDCYSVPGDREPFTIDLEYTRNEQYVIEMDDPNYGGHYNLLIPYND